MNLVDNARDALWRVMYDCRLRRSVYAVAAFLLLVLCVWPQPFVARAKILPQDNSSAGVSSILSALGGGGLQNFASLLGNRQSIEVYLIIGRSENVMADVINRLKLVGPSAQYATVQQAKVALAKKVDVHSLSGGVIEIETLTHNPDEAQALTTAYVSSISARIEALARENVSRKRQVVEDRFGRASDLVSRTEAALNMFRRRNNLADPQTQLGSALSLRTGLEARLQAKLVELQTVRRFAGAENTQLKAIQTEVVALRAQIAGTARPSSGAAGPNVAGLTEVSTEYLNLYRDYKFAQSLYEVYSRYSEEVAVQELVVDSASDVQVIEQTHIDSWRHYNIPAVALLALLGLLVVFTEIYAPATGIVLSFTPRPNNK